MIFSSSIYAQNPQKYSGVLLGKVIDKKTKKPLDYVNLSLNLNGVNIAIGFSDDDGLFTFKSLKPDSNYSLKLNYVGYTNSIINQICIKENDTLKLDLAISIITSFNSLELSSLILILIPDSESLYWS